MLKQEFSTIQNSIPTLPGIYKYFNANDKIIYVGKAKNLRKRVSSYFTKEHEYYKTRKLVSEIVRLEFTIVGSEQDALLLENSLIKQYLPKYNIALRDDRSYPHIVIKNEPFPRIFITRKMIKDGSEYLGPYTNVAEAYALLNLIKQTIPLRTCSLKLTNENIEKGKFKECLEYHIGNCKAPCVAYQNKQDYDTQITYIRDILKGKLGDIIKQYKKEMMQLATEMQFEKAEIIKRRIEYLQNYQSKSIVVSKSIHDVDVISIVSNEQLAFVNYFMIVQGAIVHTHNETIEKKLQESDEEILVPVLYLLREKYKSRSKEIIVPFTFETEEEWKLTIPKTGDKKQLLDLSIQNATYLLQEYKRKKSLHLLEPTAQETEKVLLQLQHDLHLKELPTHIECFDNSNFQGSYPVAAMVCFKNGIPYKQEYRHFHIKTVEGINDFASMQEIVFRRYKRVLEENKPIPQLIIIDGGKGQLSSALVSMKELGLLGKTTVVGLAKNVEEIFFPGDSQSLQLPFQSPSLNLVKRIRDEVHRFGITFHRNTRSKGVIKNELETIKGIGEKTATNLLNHFRSVEKVKQATEKEIEKVIGLRKAKIVKEYFKR